MDLQSFKLLIQSKVFQSTDGGIQYEFKPANTLRLKNSITHSVHYDITEEGKNFILHHNNFLGSEPVLIEIIRNESDRLELTLTTFPSGNFVGTWIEQKSF